MEAFLSKTYREDLRREKPINFTSRKFKRYLKESKTVTKLSLLRLRKMVADSDSHVENVKRGQNLNQQAKLVDYLSQKTLKLLEEPESRAAVQHYLSQTVAVLNEASKESTPPREVNTPTG